MNHNLCDNTTDEQLLELAKTNEQAFACLVDRYEKKLLSYIMRISNVNLQEAEDILQDAFIKAYTNINDFDSKLKFSSWMYRITHNEVISAYRKRKARPQGNANRGATERTFMDEVYLFLGSGAIGDLTINLLQRAAVCPQASPR